MDLLKGLNAEQKDAVLHTEGPLLILAGAGSGKTRVLTHRIAYLITEKGVHPGSILAITFTNKAAREMKERTESLLGEESKDMWVSTFHATCVRMLRRDIEKLGYTRSFVIFDTSDQQTLIKDCIKELNLNEKNFPPREVIDKIGRAKDELIEPDIYAKMNAADFRLSNIGKIYALYQEKLKRNNALDFDDIIILTIKLLLDNPPVLQYYQRKFRYILVDEYQDTNTAQYTLISLLAQQSRNLCVVGDDDQSIYGWRGANIRNILDFEKEFDNCKVVRLEQNYRSTKTILDAANHVIKNNLGRKSKSLWTENDQGCGIVLCENGNEHDEASFVVSQIKQLIRSENRNYKDFAILYRINAQSRVIEDALMREALPYRIFGGLKFYDRKEIKDLIAYLRLIQNPADDVALKRIINVPKRGIGATTLETAESIAIKKKCNIFTIVSSAAEIPELKKAAAKLENFVSIISSLKALQEDMSVHEFIGEVMEKTGILEELQQEDTVEAQTRIENVKEFTSVALDFENQSEEKGLEAFLANISLVADIDNLEEENDNIVLMTLHSAKGLEFPVVFMVGMEDGVFPSSRSIFDESELEEERRLCYVGMTRAKEKLYMTNTFTRTLFGNTTYNKASRFLKEIPEECFESFDRNQTGMDPRGLSQNITNQSGIGYNGINQKRTGFSIEDYMNTFGSANERKPAFGSGTAVNSGTAAGTARTKSSGSIVGFGRVINSVADVSRVTSKSAASEYKKGDKVVHKKFGEGTIISVEKENDDFKLEIQFKNHGMKRLMAAFANLTRIQE